jgi:glycerol-3-phosphate O-acyltransferase
VLFLERRTGFWGDRIDHRISAPMRQLVAAAASDRSLEVDLIPVTVMWGRAPDREGSWLRVLLSENWERVGASAASSRSWSTAAICSCSSAIRSRCALRSMTAQMPRARAPAHSTLRLALGAPASCRDRPDLSHRRTIVTQVLRAGSVRRAMADEMRAKKISRREALKLGQDYATEIAANYSHVMVAIIARILTWFWTRLYDGVELHHFDQLPKLADATRSSTCRATAATSITCCCPTRSTTKASRSRTSPPA